MIMLGVVIEFFANVIFDSKIHKNNIILKEKDIL